MTGRIPLPTGAIERELGWACQVLGEMMVAMGLPRETNPAIREAAIERFQRFATPAAIIGIDKTLLANTAWTATFSDVLPPWAPSSIEVVRRTRMGVHLPDVGSVAGQAASYSASLAPGTLSGEDVVLVVCAELNDDVIARELVITTDALVWSGRVSSPTNADYCNERMQIQIGRPLIREWQSIVHADDLSTWMRMLTEATRTGASTEAELRLRLQDDERAFTVCVATTNNNNRWFTIAHEVEYPADRDRMDLLDRVRRARLDAIQAHRVKDHVLAAVSHELRAPVTTMMLWERVLRDPNADATARVQALDAIHQSAAAQSRIVADLLDMSRAISGKLHVDFRSVEIGKLVGGSIESFVPAALAKRISLVHEGSTFTGDILADAARLRQVLDNLLSNAIKFTNVGGKVRVRVERKRPNLVIVVEDDGRGIPSHLLERIFEPFRQGGDDISSRQGGLGLGLAIAKQLVELHHGTLEATSEGQGKGARFTLTLPIAGHRRAPSPPVGVASARSLVGARVLLVDDDVRVRNALALLLNRAGAQVVPVESALAAREGIEEQKPQIILCDIAMPDEDGYEFMRSLRAAGSKIPAIALTAYASRADAERALSSGFDLHVAKPVDFDGLVASVAQLLHAKRGQT